MRQTRFSRQSRRLVGLWKRFVAENVAAGIEEQAQKMIERARSFKKQRSERNRKLENSKGGFKFEVQPVY
jgi:hypothetical protein